MNSYEQNFLFSGDYKIKVWFYLTFCIVTTVEQVIIIFVPLLFYLHELYPAINVFLRCVLRLL